MKKDFNPEFPQSGVEPGVDSGFDFGENVASRNEDHAWRGRRAPDQGP